MLHTEYRLKVKKPALADATIKDDSSSSLIQHDIYRGLQTLPTARTAACRKEPFRKDKSSVKDI
ncbi:hypothetical protein Vi05172_g3762 [Venturia inaequalis]|nr:hypothetical protein Vi05172_g3762 [Venturia inaequalis]